MPVAARSLLVLAYLAAFAVPLLAGAGLDTSSLAYDVSGNGCRRLTDAGREDLEAAVLPLRLSLLAWTLIGAGGLAAGWWRRFEGAPVRPLVLGGWCLGVAASVLPIWFGPATDALGKAFLIVLYAPAVLLVTAILLIVAVTRRHDGRRPPFPAVLLFASLGLLLVAMVAGGWLGGSDETLIC